MPRRITNPGAIVCYDTNLRAMTVLFKGSRLFGLMRDGGEGRFLRYGFECLKVF